MKDIYDFSNETEVNLNEYEKVELNDIEKQEIKRNIKTTSRKIVWKKVVGTVIAASLVFVVFLQTNPGKSVYAEVKEIIVETFNFKQEEAYDRKDDLEQFVVNTNEMIYGEDYKIKIESVMLHENELTITSIIEYDKEQSDDYYIQGIYYEGLRIGDKKINLTKKGGGAGPVEDNPKVKYEQMSILLNDEELEEFNNSVDIQINAKGLILKENGEPRAYGEKFEVILKDIKINNISDDKKKGNVDVSIKDKKREVNYKITGYEFNPFEQKIYAESDIDLKNEEMVDLLINRTELYLEGTDENGKKVEFSGYYDIDENFQNTNKIVFRAMILEPDMVIEKEISEDVGNVKKLNLRMKVSEESGIIENDDGTGYSELLRYEKIGKKFTIEID